MSSLIDLDSAREIFTRWFLPWLEFLEELDRKDGQLQFKPKLGHYLKANSYDSYPFNMPTTSVRFSKMIFPIKQGEVHRAGCLT